MSISDFSVENPVHSDKTKIYVFTPHNFSRRCDKAKFTDIHLNYIKQWNKKPSFMELSAIRKKKKSQIEIH